MGHIPEGRHSSGLDVLVVDAYRDAADTLATLLTLLLGCLVRVAYDGPTALALAREAQPDVVVLDLVLPGLDGYAVARRLREEAGARTPLLIAFTGYGRQGDRVRSKEAGFDAHLMKTDLEDLITLLRRLPREQRPGE